MSVLRSIAMVTKHSKLFKLFLYLLIYSTNIEHIYFPIHSPPFLVNTWIIAVSKGTELWEKNNMT